jgi:hypothetical protein
MSTITSRTHRAKGFSAKAKVLAHRRRLKTLLFGSVKAKSD